MPQADNQTAAAGRKPRLALMGEFSAGKSTLTNLLLGRQPLPVRVTATRLPPVWISHGPEAAHIVAHDGSEAPVPAAALDNVPFETTALIRLTLPADVLELCDLIDMPGISDPNMPSGAWQALLPEADSVIWCTHATQAWRQSEAALWERILPDLPGPSTLLVTHFDKLRNPRDRERVLKRVRKETEGQFSAVFPVSLRQALQAGEDAEAWKNSGADRFVDHLVDQILNWDAAGRNPPAQGAAQAAKAVQADPEPAQAEILAMDRRRAAAPCGNSGTHVSPRRVKPERRGERPPARPRSRDAAAGPDKA